MSFRSSILAGTKLIRAAIQSPNYSAGVSGWTVNQDGSAEFNNITIRGGSSIGGTSLYYNGTPALGNLIASISPTAGVDAFGNNYGAGFTAYNQSSLLFSQLVAGQLSAGALTGAAGSAPDTANAPKLFESSPGALFVYGGNGSSAPTNDGVGMILGAGASNQPTGTTNPAIFVSDGNQNSAVDMWISGNVGSANVLGQPETWHRIGYLGYGYGSAWADNTIYSGLGGDPLAYRLNPDDTLTISGLAGLGAGAISTTIFQLPPGYRPKSGFTPHGEVKRSASGTGVQTTQEIAVVGATGAVIISSALGNGDQFSFNTRIPLRNFS